MKPDRPLRLITLFLGLVCGLSAAAPAALEAHLKTWIAGQPGCIALAFVDRESVTFAEAGRLAPDDAQPPTPDTLFEIGSVTKIFTGLLLAESERVGKISRHDSAAKFLLPADDPALPALSQITLTKLTTHTSGLPHMPANMLFAGLTPDPYRNYDRKKLLIAFRAHGPFVAKDAPQSYSNFGVALLGEALGEAWHDSYASALTQHVLTPLGLAHTTLALTDSPTPDLLAPALANGARTSYWTFAAMAPAGALRSSTRDLSLFLQTCLGYRATPLASALTESFKPLRPTAGFPGQIGMGWFITASADKPILWHNGGTGGFRAFIGFCPATGQGIALLTNSANDPTRLGLELLSQKNTSAPAPHESLPQASTPASKPEAAEQAHN